MSGLKPLHCEVERGLNSDEKNDWIIFLNWIISRWRNSFNITIIGQAKVNYCRIILPIVLCLKQFPNCHIPYHDHQPIWQVLVNSYKKVMYKNWQMPRLITTQSGTYLWMFVFWVLITMSFMPCTWFALVCAAATPFLVKLGWFLDALASLDSKL